jgi:hypothetical protein
MPLIVGGIGAMGSALLMPWITVASPVAGVVTRTGMQLHDVRLFAVALIALGFTAWSEARRPRATTRSALLVGLIALGVAGVMEYRDLTQMVAGLNADFAGAKLGFGVFAMGLGLMFSLAGVLKRRIVMQPVAAAEESEQFAA